MEEDGGPGPLSWVGCGCGCLSGLLILVAIMLVMATLLGAIALDGGILWGSAGGGLCVGLVGLIIGIALYIKGQR